MRKHAGPFFQSRRWTIFTVEEFPTERSQDRVFSVEYLPGQFDQRADSAVQCVKFLKEDEEPMIKSATTYVIEGNITDEEFEAIKNHCINPVDSRETGHGEARDSGD